MIETLAGPSLTVLRMAHGKASAFDTPFLHALTAALRDAERSDARAIVLTGSGAIFSAGVDLVALRDATDADLAAFLPALSECFRVLYTLRTPVVAAVNGHAIAGGCVLACACDHRLMARGRGRIGVAEHQVGVPFPWLALEIVRHALPPPHAEEAIVLGDTYPAEEALARGFVHELVDGPGLMARAEAVAARLAAIPPATFALTKETRRRPVLDAWAEAGPGFDQRVLEAWGSGEVRAAVGAYVARTLRK